jgi:hypothetical protein
MRPAGQQGNMRRGDHITTAPPPAMGEHNVGDRMPAGPEAPRSLPDLSLLGGPLYRLGNRLGLIRGGTDPTPLGLALGGGLWVVLIALAFVDGISRQVFTLSVIGVHVRLLVTLPLLFFCEAQLNPHLDRFARMIVQSRVVPSTALPRLESEIARLSRWRDSWVPEAICLLAAVLLTAFLPHIYLTGETVRASGAAGLTADWYWHVCMTLFRFVVLRWFWRLCLWWHFLWQLSRLGLHLVPTHPDRAGGLGYVTTVHRQFAALILALSATQAATFADRIALGGMTLRDFYPQIIVILLLYAALFLAPLLVFYPAFAAARSKGQAEYGELASRYVNEFDTKWVHPVAPPDEPLLGTPDMQSLADLINSVTAARNMRLSPVNLELIQWLAMAALLPMLPLVLLIYPFASLAVKLCEGVVGL